MNKNRQKGLPHIKTIGIVDDASNVTQNFFLKMFITGALV